jgi:2'-5' RNA ligase
MIEKIKARVLQDIKIAESEGFIPTGLATLYLLLDVSERLKDLEEEQRQAAQIAERQATAAADLAEIKAKQAKEQPDQHGNNGDVPGEHAADDEQSARDPGVKKEEESQNKLRLDVLNAFIDDIKRSGEALVINEDADRPEVVQRNTGMMLALLLDPETAQRLALAGGEPASELHITLAYLGDMEDEETDERLRPDTMREPMLRIVDAIASTSTPLSGRIAGIGRFAPAETDTTPVLALVDIPGLAEFRAELVAAIDQAGYFVADNHGYTPHVTLAYIDAAEPTPIATVPQVELTFDTVWLCIGDERIAFKLGGPVPPPTGEIDAKQETHTQSRETDDVRPGPDQSESDGTLHQNEEVVGAGRSQLDRGSTAGEGEADGIADRSKAELAAWMTELFHSLKERGASSSPTLATVASIYAFSDAEQAALAQKLAEVNVAAQRYCYSRDMVAVGLTPQIEEGLLSKVGDLLSWGREQVSSIVSTMKEQLSTFIGNLKGDSNVAEQVNGWIDRYADYKAPQVANVAWGTGANDGSMQAIEDIMDAATDPNRPKPLDTESIRVKVTPSYSSGDYCADYAGKDYSLNEYAQLGIEWPAHPNCRHGIEIIRKDGGEV